MEQVTADDGITYELELGKGKTGYKNVVELRPGQFHAKFVPDKSGDQDTSWPRARRASLPRRRRFDWPST